MCLCCVVHLQVERLIESYKFKLMLLFGKLCLELLFQITCSFDAGGSLSSHDRRGKSSFTDTSAQVRQHPIGAGLQTPNWTSNQNNRLISSDNADKHVHNFAHRDLHIDLLVEKLIDIIYISYVIAGFLWVLEI